MVREQESNHLQWTDLALSRHLICIQWINDRVEEIKIQMRKALLKLSKVLFVLTKNK